MRGFGKSKLLLLSTLLLVLIPAMPDAAAFAGTLRIPRSWNGIWLDMTLSELKRMRPQIREVMRLEEVPDFDPQDFDPKADTLDQCEAVGCTGVVIYQDADSTVGHAGYCQYTFFKRKLASFYCFTHQTQAAQTDRAWRAKYGNPEPDVEWQKELHLLSGKDTVPGAIGDIWQDSRTRVTLEGGDTDQDPAITLEDLAEDRAMRGEAAKIVAEGPKTASESSPSPEPFCDQMADVVKRIAEMRDEGVDEEIALSSYRAGIKAFTSRKLTRTAENAFSPVIASIYARPEVTPVEARADWLLECYALYPTGTPGK